MKPIIDFLRKWNEIITLPLAIFLWWFSRDLFRAIDPSAGVYDIGILQVFLLATIGLLFIHALVWIILKIAANDTYNALENIHTNSKISPWKKAKYSLCYFWGLLFAWVLLVIALI